MTLMMISPVHLAFTDDVDEACDTCANEKGKKLTNIIQHIMMLCGFPEDSLMVEVIKQEGWTSWRISVSSLLTRSRITGLLRGDGMHLGCSMMVHICMFKAFLLYYKRKSRDHTYPPDEEDVLEYTKFVFNEYCRSDQYTKDVITGGYQRCYHMWIVVDEHDKNCSSTLQQSR
jgi:hypothetical protein